MTPIIGTGLFILGAVVWIMCAVYAYRVAPTFGRSRPLWTGLTVVLGPIALMILYVLPKKHPSGTGGAKKADPRDALYEVHKKR